MDHTQPSDEDEPQSGDREEAEKPHGMPLTLGSGGYGLDPCTGPDAERAGECPDDDKIDRAAE